MTPSPLPPPPRAVRFRPGAALRVWGIRLFMIPFLVVGVVLTLFVLEVPVIRVVGTERLARIVAVEPNARYRDGTHVVIRFDFETGNGHAVEGGTIDTADSSLPAVGDPIAVYTVPHSLTRRAVVADHRFTGGPTGGCGGLFLATAAALAFAGNVAAWIGPIRDRRRIRTGTAVPGIVVAKWTNTELPRHF